MKETKIFSDGIGRPDTNLGMLYIVVNERYLLTAPE